ncbi:MAG: hypothetical protein LBE12_00470 [Planctomycetaceae bacterium]|jgi:hypothetical protein|nr:hypothetical protein [Planctomycetaceae bacterium]
MKILFFKTFISFLCCFVILVLLGCQNTNPDGRENVSGRILLNGQPLQGSARIVFDPLEGSQQDGGSGQIMSGNFLLTQQDGVKPGKYCVRIFATITYDKTTNLPATKETRDYNEYTMSIIPPEFNVNSDLEFEVIKGKKNVYNYNIVTSLKPIRINKSSLTH